MCLRHMNGEAVSNYWLIVTAYCFRKLMTINILQKLVARLIYTRLLIIHTISRENKFIL
jgi:hypothetical protein